MVKRIRPLVRADKVYAARPPTEGAHMLWDLIQQYQIGQLDQRIERTQADAADGSFARRATLRVEDRVDRLALICCAMFELMEQTSGVSEAQLRAKIVEIDMRDGRADNRVTPEPKRCPKCDAMIAPRFGRCLFCGYQDDAANPIL